MNREAMKNPKLTPIISCVPDFLIHPRTFQISFRCGATDPKQRPGFPAAGVRRTRVPAIGFLAG